MSSLKKDKGASAPEAQECVNCLARSGQNGGTLLTCTRCKASTYCGKACQTAHWKAGHKKFCVPPEERAPQPAGSSPASSGAPVVLDDQGPIECPICLDPLASGNVCTLPCTHTFHASCVEGLRSFGIKQVCPMCRAELPPGPKQLFEDAARRFFELERRVDRGEVSWGALTKAQKLEMDDVVGMWRSAADQGHADSQFNLGVMYRDGQGVQQDYAKALNWYLKAAEQEHATAQYNIGCIYTKGQGVNQDFAKAVNWFRKAADQGFDRAKEAVLGAEGALRKQRQVPPRATTVPRSPSTPKCANCGVAETAGSSVTLKPCPRCKALVYCGKACQAAHWKAGGHRAVCK